MRKLSIFVAAFVLTLGLAQCKKEQPATPQDTDSNLVHITVNVGNGSRADIADPSNSGHYTFKNGDKLYVGYDNACAGTLVYNTSTSKFSGEINLTQNGEQPLHFYYLGGGTATRVEETQQYTVDINDQSENYPVISYGTSNVDYTGTGNYTTTLLNKCALVKFATNEIPVGTAVVVSGLNNKVEVNFNRNTLSYSQTNNGSITLHTENATSRWAILLPQAGLSNVKANAEGYDEAAVSFRDVSSINENDYLTESASFTLTAAPSVPTGAISGVFTINDHGGKVYFSQGNLQYNKSTEVWSFMEHQYDMVEANDQDVGKDYANQNIVSLFGWGAWTSGQNPWETDPYAEYQYNTEPTVCNQTNWRALTSAEWQYLFSNHNYGEHKVCGVNGLLVLPDGVDSATGFVNEMDGIWDEVSNGEWAAMEAAGAVFLPAAGSRFGTNVYGVGEWGNYWSSTYYYEGDPKAYNLFFEEDILNATESGAELPNGQSVRLVQDKAN